MKTLDYYSSNTSDAAIFPRIVTAAGPSLENLNDSTLTWVILAAISLYQAKTGINIDIPDNDLKTIGFLLRDLSLDGLLSVIHCAADQLKSDRPE